MKEKGATRVSLDVLCDERASRATVWQRLGFEEVALVMATPLDALERRLADDAGRRVARRRSTSRATTTRLGRARGRAVRAAARGARGRRPRANGWIRIRDPLFDADRDAQCAASRASSPTGSAPSSSRSRSSTARSCASGSTSAAAWSTSTSRCRRSTAQLSKGDELALEANPTLVARLTGADRDDGAAVMRTATSPADLPPAEELYEAIARTMGLEP